MQKEELIGKVLKESSTEDNVDLLIALESLLEVYKERKNGEQYPRIPAYIFASRKLGVLEVTVKCLKENYSLSFRQIALLLKRDDRTIWSTYQKAKKKYKNKFVLKKGIYAVPCFIFSDRQLGPLESLVIFFKENYALSFTQISNVLNRDYQTIWLSYQNGIKKKVIKNEI